MTEPPVDGLIDIEVGAEVFSKTIQTGGGFQAGGVVTAVAITEDGSFEFSVLRWRTEPPFNPYVQIFEGDDIDLPVTRLTARAAKGAAAKLSAWLGDKKQKSLQHDDRVRWQRVALDLTEADTGRTWIRHAQARVDAALIEARKPAPIVIGDEPTAERLSELEEQLAESIRIARAKRQGAA